jgi:hypothetical protein
MPAIASLRRPLAVKPALATKLVSDHAGATPFRNAGEAWFWTMACLTARHQGVRGTGKSAVIRSCEPDDVVRCLDQLYRQRRINLTHARILRVWGERQSAPNPTYASERGDWSIWQEALDRLEWPLRIKGIVS